MTKPTYKYRYFDKKGNELHRRSNLSDRKLAILWILYRLDKNDVRATAYDQKLQDRFYDVAVIAQHLNAPGMFEDGKLSESARTSLNRSLSALEWDGFVKKTGNRYHSRDWRTGLRDFQRNHFALASEGKKVLASDHNGYLTSWMAQNRYVGRSGAYSILEVVKALNDEI